MSIQEERFAQIAAAIREKDGSTEPIKALDFATRILSIPTGGGGTTGFAVPLVVTVDTNAEVTAVNGDITVSGTTDADNKAHLTLTAPGVWTVTAKQGDKEKSDEIEVMDGYASKISLLSRLPAGYTEVEYIQSDNKCGINTGFTVNFSTTQIVMDIEAEAYTSGNEYLLTMLGVSSRYYCFLTRKSATTMQFRYYTRDIVTVNSDITGKRVIINWDFLNAKLTIEETSVTTSKANYTMSTPLHLLALNSNGVSIHAKIFSAKVYSNGIIQRDFVPCISPSGEAGLFDLLNKQFYANISTGTFTPGPAV